MAALNAEIADELKRKLDIECTARDVTLRSAISEAIKDWLGEDSDDGPPSPYVVKLERILASGDTLAINAVSLNIDLFYDRLRPRPTPAAKRKTGT